MKTSMAPGSNCSCCFGEILGTYDSVSGAMIEFQKLRESLENEMDNRFANQDEIIDNLSNSVKTFQDTMKIIGQTFH